MARPAHPLHAQDLRDRPLPSAAAIAQTSWPAAAKRIQITTLRELGASNLPTPSSTASSGITATPNSKLQARIDDFRNAMLALKSTPAGSQIRLEWLPGSGTRLSVGNEVRGKDIPGEDFYRALLRIWLGENPSTRPEKRPRNQLKAKPQTGPTPLPEHRARRISLMKASITQPGPHSLHRIFQR
jgi:hypothetical protein